MKKLLLLLILIATICPAEQVVKLRFENNIIDDTGRVWNQSFSNPMNNFSNTVYKRDDYSIYSTSASNGSIVNFAYEDDTHDLTGDFTIQFWAAIDIDTAKIFGTPHYGLRYWVSGDKNMGCYFGVEHNLADPTQYKPAIQLYTTDANTTGMSVGDWETGINWHHCCFERRSGTIYAYLDGKEIFSVVDASSFEPSGVFVIGELASAYADGTIYIDHLTVHRDEYIYGGEFIPLERPRLSFSPKEVDLTVMPDEYTKNLLHFESDFSDVSGDSWLTEGAWYVPAPGTSNWTIQADAAKFGAGGIEDLARPKYNWGILESEVPSKFWYGTGDFTIEYWIRINDITTPEGTTNLLDFFAYADLSNYWQFYSRQQSSGTSTYSLAVGAATLSGGAWVDTRQSSYQSVNVGDWVHIAGVRSSGTFTVYVNGSSVLSFSTTTAQYVFNSTNAANINMQRVYNGASNLNCTINIDEFRAANYAIYTSNFTPPTEPYGNIKDNKLYFSGILRLLTRLPDSDTISLFHFDETGDETSDLGESEWIFTTKDAYADVTISTGGKFGKALYDGTGTAPDAWWMTNTATAAIDIGTGDYSFEFWFYPGTGSINYGNIFNAFYLQANGLPGGSYRLMNAYFYNDGSNKWAMNPSYAGDQLAIMPYAMDGNWRHICVERYAGAVTIYIDGVSQMSTTGAQAIADFSAATSWTMGRATSGGAGILNNWKIDELKITNKAVYMGNFTPPTTPYYYYGTNKLGLRGD